MRRFHSCGPLDPGQLPVFVPTLDEEVPRKHSAANYEGKTTSRHSAPRAALAASVFGRPSRRRKTASIARPASFSPKKTAATASRDAAYPRHAAAARWAFARRRLTSSQFTFARKASR